MNVFLSWSGDAGFKVARALHDWLPQVIQAVRPFISSGDIAKGQRWADVLKSELDSAAYGIICVTPFNVQKPWLNFEAGAMSKQLDGAAVSPFLFRVCPDGLEGPLQQFQSTVYDKKKGEDVLRLVRSINNRQAVDCRVPDEILEKQFARCWGDLQTALDAIQFDPKRETETGIPWMYSRTDLSHIAIQGICRSIWIISPDLYNHVAVPALKEELLRNIANHIDYTFITSRSEDTELPLVLIRLAAAHPDQIRIRSLPEKEFRALAATDYIIFDPLSENLRMFLELPVTNRGYWIEVALEAATNFVYRFGLAVAQGREEVPPAPAEPATAGNGSVAPAEAVAASRPPVT